MNDEEFDWMEYVSILLSIIMAAVVYMACQYLMTKWDNHNTPKSWYQRRKQPSIKTLVLASNTSPLVILKQQKDWPTDTSLQSYTWLLLNTVETSRATGSVNVLQRVSIIKAEDASAQFKMLE